MLVHGDAGTDATLQVTSLTQVLLDPHCRTIKGWGKQFYELTLQFMINLGFFVSTVASQGWWSLFHFNWGGGGGEKGGRGRGWGRGLGACKKKHKGREFVEGSSLKKFRNLFSIIISYLNKIKYHPSKKKGIQLHCPCKWHLHGSMAILCSFHCISVCQCRFLTISRDLIQVWRADWQRMAAWWPSIRGAVRQSGFVYK